MLDLHRVFLVTVAPTIPSIRSVWSRERPGSRTLTLHPAVRPANKMALFTCALATGEA